MTTALTERDDVTYDGEIVEHRAPLTLFGTDDPAAVVERATRVATVLADVIKQRRLSAHIGDRDHIMLEGWTLLGSMLGVFGEVEWTRPIADGWEARAVARTMSGVTVGSAEAMCTRAERTWKQRDEYAIRSMAQTRALSKALRLPLGFIVELAGFAATPAEEMDAIEQPDRRGGERPSGQAPSSPRGGPAPRNKGDALGRLAEVARDHNLSFAQVDAKAREIGVDRRAGGVEDILRLIAAIEHPEGRAVQADAAPGGQTASPESQPGESAPSPADTPEAGKLGPVSGPTSQTETVSSDATTPAASDVSPVTEPSAVTLDDVLEAAGEGAEVIPPELQERIDKARAKGKKAEPQQETLAEALGAPER